jgi:hypothetical protein
MSKKPFDEDRLKKMIETGKSETINVDNTKTPITDHAEKPQVQDEPVVIAKTFNTSTEQAAETVAKPTSRKQSMEQYREKFLTKQPVALRRNVPISEETYQKLKNVYNACFPDEVQLTTYLGYIINDHIEQHKDVLKDFQKNKFNAINL